MKFENDSEIRFFFFLLQKAIPQKQKPKYFFFLHFWRGAVLVSLLTALLDGFCLFLRKKKYHECIHNILLSSYQKGASVEFY